MPLIHISSNAVFERPLSRYGLSKIIQETLLRDVAFTIRIPHLYGRNTKSPCALDRWLYGVEREIVVRDPQRDIDFLPIESFVWVVNALLAGNRVRAGKTLNLGSGERKPLLEWALAAAAQTHKKVRVETLTSAHTHLMNYRDVTVQEALEWLNPTQSWTGVPV